MQNLLEYKIDLIAAHLGVYKIEDVVTVMRRQHTSPEDGRIVDVIDFYPSWNQYGTYGKMKLCHEYLDESWQVSRFEQYAGVKVADLPIYDGQTALIRRFGQTHRCETAVQPFRLMVQPRTDENGNSAKTLILKYLTAPQTRRQQTAAPTAPSSPPPSQQPTPPPDEPPKPSALTQEEWLEQASAATTDFDLDTCLSRAFPIFATADNVTKTRTLMFGEWVDGRAVAYTAGLRAYAEKRKRIQDSGQGVTTAHAEAKVEAMNVYHKALEALEFA